MNPERRLIHPVTNVSHNKILSAPTSMEPQTPLSAPSQAGLQPPPLLSSSLLPRALLFPSVEQSCHAQITSQNDSVPDSLDFVRRTARGRVERSGTKGTGRGLGSKNYTPREVSILLNLVENVLPLGYQEWSIVTSQYSEWQTKNDTPVRDLQILKSKFDKLVNAKKPTGSPDCPDPVRRAKNIAKSMQSRCAAAPLGVEDSSEDEMNDDTNSSSTIDLVAGTRVHEKRRVSKVGQKQIVDLLELEASNQNLIRTL